MPRDPRLYLDDILEAIDHIHEFVIDIDLLSSVGSSGAN